MLAKTDDIQLTPKARVVWTLTSVVLGFFMGAVPVSILAGVMLNKVPLTMNGTQIDDLFHAHPAISPDDLKMHFTHSPTNPSSGNSSELPRRRLDDLDDMVRIGTMAYDTINLL